MAWYLILLPLAAALAYRWLASRIDGPVQRTVGDLKIELVRPSETITLSRPQQGVTATLSRTDLPEMFAGFSRFQPDYLIVTKVDETRRPSIFTSLPFESDRRVAFVTDGQRVPQDIFAARPDRIADLVFQTVESAPAASPAPAGKELR